MTTDELFDGSDAHLLGDEVFPTSTELVKVIGSIGHDGECCKGREKDRMDAARYRWLRLCTSMSTEEIASIANYAGTEFDASIDAAMQAEIAP
ncbi:hypothetical protein [Propionivibrio sp.]|uniref:hypothetical protein n=1 Tax=Propionivibrio sp. TaxID=2212460 RepID=UPI003BEF9CD5